MKKELEREITQKGLVEDWRPPRTTGGNPYGNGDSSNHEGYKIEDDTSGSGTGSGSKSREESSDDEEEVLHDGQ